jgi:hypothetical protein
VKHGHEADDRMRGTRRPGGVGLEPTETEGARVTEQFERGDRVEWSFRGRTVTGRVRRRLTRRAEIGGRVVAAAKDDPRCVVRSDRSGKETTRRPGALRRIDA